MVDDCFVALVARVMGSGDLLQLLILVAYNIVQYLRLFYEIIIIKYKLIN